MRRECSIAAVLTFSFVTAVAQPVPPSQPSRPAGVPAGQPPGEQSRPTDQGGQRRQAPVRDASARRETPLRGTSSLTGRIVAADSGRPVRRARVTVGVAGGASRSALTDDAGRFDVTELAAGRYVVTVTKTGFVTLSFGQRRPGQPPMPIAVADGERLEGVDFVLPRGGVITGRVLDETGDAVPGIGVRVFRSAYSQGERTLLPSGVDQTDDRGEYRVYGLAPGDYVVSAQPRGEGDFGPGRGQMQGGMQGPMQRPGAFGLEDAQVTQGYAPTYYPGTPIAGEAGRVTVDVSQEVAGIDMLLQQVPFARVSGRVTMTSGAPRNGVVALTGDGVAAGPRGGQTTRLEADGTFSLASVPPGRYRLSVRALPPDSDTPMFASQAVTVSGVDVTGLVLSLGAGAELSGTVVAEGSGRGSGFDLGQIRVSVRAPGRQLFGEGATATASPEGTFVVRGISAGPQLVSVSRLPRGWTLKQVLLGGRDVADVPIDVRGSERMTGAVVVITDRATEVSGIVRDSRGEPNVEATVVLFAADTDYWGPSSRRIDAVRPDQTGRFVARGLPAGEYFAAAVEVVEQGEWFDPQFLEGLTANATRVSLADGDVKTVDVRTAAPRQR